VDLRKVKKIAGRMTALFLVSALTAIGAGAIIGIDTIQTAVLAGIISIANVIEDLSRGYLNDGSLTNSEIDEAFANNIPDKR
jgi:uncharacterized membrane protein